MNAHQKKIAVAIYNDLYKRASVAEDHAKRKIFGDTVAAVDAQRAAGLRIALQYIGQFLYEYSKHDRFDVERAAKAVREDPRSAAGV